MENMGIVFAVLGGVLAALMAGLGSVKGVRMVGEAAAGLVSVDPSKFSKVLLLELLPGTQGLYGLLIAIILFGRIGILGGPIHPLTLSQGLLYFLACMPMAVVGLLSAFAQAKVAAAGVAVVAKKPEHSGKSIIMAAMVETYAILALLISIIVISNL